MTLEMLLANVLSPGPNLTHMLLGMGDAVRQLKRQRYGTEARARRTIELELSRDFGWEGDSCFHAILYILDQYVSACDASKTVSRESFASWQRLASLCYKLLCLLCEQRDTSAFVIQHLSHQRGGFWCSHFKFLLNVQLSPEHDDIRAWVYRGIALELSTFSGNDYHQDAEVMRILNDLYFRVNGTLPILTHLEECSLEVEVGNELEMVPEHAKDVIDKCKIQTSDAYVISVPVLHKMLIERLFDKSISKRNEETIKAVLIWAYKYNQHARIIARRTRLVSAWASIVNVTFSKCLKQILSRQGPCGSMADSTLNAGVFERLLYDIISEILRKLESSSEAHASVAAPLSRTVSLLMDMTRGRCGTIGFSNAQCHYILRTICSILCRIPNAVARGGVLRVTAGGMGSLYGRSQQSRATLLVTLLHYLQYTRALVPQAQLNHDMFSEIGDESGEQTRPILLTTVPTPVLNERFAGLMRGNEQLLNSTDDSNIDFTMKDASSGTLETRTISLRVLDAMLAYDSTGRWVQHMCRQGFFVVLFDAMVAKQYGKPNGLQSNYKENLRFYSSAISLISRIACSKFGAQQLLEQGILNFAESFAPLREFGSMDDQLFHTLAMPLLRVLLTMLCRLSKPNKQAVRQILSIFMQPATKSSTVPILLGMLRLNTDMSAKDGDERSQRYASVNTPSKEMKQSVGRDGDGIIARGRGVSPEGRRSEEPTLQSLRRVQCIVGILSQCVMCFSEFKECLGDFMEHVDSTIRRHFLVFSSRPAITQEFGIVRTRAGNWFSSVRPATKCDVAHEQESVIAPAHLMGRGKFWKRFQTDVWRAGRGILRHCAQYCVMRVDFNRQLSPEHALIPLFQLPAADDIDGDGIPDTDDKEFSVSDKSGGQSDTGGVSPDLLRALVVIIRRAAKDAQKCVDTMPQSSITLENDPLSSSVDSHDASAQGMRMQMIHSRRHFLDVLFIMETSLTILLSHVQHFLSIDIGSRQSIFVCIDEVIRYMKTIYGTVRSQAARASKSHHAGIEETGVAGTGDSRPWDIPPATAEFIHTVMLRLDGFRMQTNNQYLPKNEPIK